MNIHPLHVRGALRNFTHLLTGAVNDGLADRLTTIVGARYGFPAVPEDFEDLAYRLHRLERYYHDVVVPHKVAVYKAGEALVGSLQGSPMALTKEQTHEFEDRLLQHDLSKFSDAEQAYVYYDFKGENDEDATEAFNRAWHHHKRMNSHHPEFHFDVAKTGATSAMSMPHLDIVEMVADWMGAGETYGTPLREWLPENLPRFRFHPVTAMRLRRVLEALDLPTKIAAGGFGLTCMYDPAK